MRLIDERPVEALDRLQGGHWEGDLIMGTGNRSAIGTLVERITRYVILLHLPGAIGTADAVRHAVTSTLVALPGGLRRTLTWDQGKKLGVSRLRGKPRDGRASLNGIVDVHQDGRVHPGVELSRTARPDAAIAPAIDHPSREFELRPNRDATVPPHRKCDRVPCPFPVLRRLGLPASYAK